MYHGLLNQAQYKDYHDVGIAGVAYDSMWSIALGLDKASKKIAAGNDTECSDLPGDLVPLEEFDYSNEKLGCILKNSIDEVSFIGVTVRILYYKTQVYMHSISSVTIILEFTCTTSFKVVYIIMYN